LRGEAWRLLVANHQLIEDWLKQDGLTAVKVHDLPCRRAIVVPQRQGPAGSPPSNFLQRHHPPQAAPTGQMPSVRQPALP
jgi:hypothetical protein